MDIRQGPIGRAMGLKLVRIGTLGSTESWALRPGQALLCVVILDEFPIGLLAPHVTRERAASLEPVSR